MENIDPISYQNQKLNLTLKQIENNVASHYSNKIIEHGPSFLGVDWGTKDGQIIRFEQLTKVFDLNSLTDVIDFGCGYGALFDYLHTVGYRGRYQGFDISAAMINEAKRLYDQHKHVHFTTELNDVVPADYSLVSGVFNIKNDAPEKEWLDYILSTMEQVYSLSHKGFVFNVLSAQKTPSNQRDPELYYADQDFILDYCRQQFDAKVALWDDYPLNDFTVFVRLRIR